MSRFTMFCFALVMLFNWDDFCKPKPNPTPSPTINPTSTPTAIPTPTPTPTAPPTPEDPCQDIHCDAGYHCKNGNCIQDIPTTDNPCPKELAPGAYAYMNDKPYGQGFDSTVRVKGDSEFCFIIHGERINDCHLEGWSRRVQCELKLAGGCPIWQYSTNNGKSYSQCYDDQGAAASCDHFGNPTFRDDPKTPTTGDTLETLRGFEGQPQACGLQRNQLGPVAGYFTIAHGIGVVRACLANGTNCGPWRPFNH